MRKTIGIAMIIIFFAALFFDLSHLAGVLIALKILGVFIIGAAWILLSVYLLEG